MSRPSLGLAIIAKNEAENLPRLFKSFEGCFDEVHLTDTGSTDNTVEVAKSLGATVHHFQWCDDFAKARNASFEPIKTDYVMWIDCDDVMGDKDAFILWRDNCMYLADYWLANYHYSLDSTGKPNCSFLRERIFKNNMGFKWKYPVHEGVIPLSPLGDIKPQATNAWAIKHLRTDDDLQKDRSRNLNILKIMESEGKLDARMTYYYGKELFECGFKLESILHLGRALAFQTLEMHDRLLAMQYLAYAYMMTDAFDKATQIAQQGALLQPNRAEFWNVLGDSYLKMGRMHEAVPFYRAAAGCFFSTPDQQMDVIFRTEAAYTVHPRNMIARIYAQMGDFTRANELAKETVKLYPNDESLAISKELERIVSVSTAYKTAKPCEDIVITTPPVTPYSFDADTMKEKALGGSETALVEMAYWLKKKSGRNVIVFNMRDAEKDCDGVKYVPVQTAANYFAENKPWVHIAWRHNAKITDAPTFIWNHDLTTPGLEHTQNYVKALALTPFHQDYMHIMQKVPYEKIMLTRNGLNPSKFEGLEKIEKDPWRFVFGSSPDRGLDRCMLVLDKVRVKYPQIKLHIHYGIEHLDKYGLQNLRVYLQKMMEDRKDWVVYEGPTKQKDLMESYAKSAYLIQPSDWIETFCITAIELLSCGVYPIFRKVGGVADVLRTADADGMAHLVDSDCITESQRDLYARATINAIEQEAYRRVKFDINSASWEKVAQQWLDQFPRVIDESNI